MSSIFSSFWKELGLVIDSALLRTSRAPEPVVLGQPLPRYREISEETGAVIFIAELHGVTPSPPPPRVSPALAVLAVYFAPGRGHRHCHKLSPQNAKVPLVRVTRARRPTCLAR